VTLPPLDLRAINNKTYTLTDEISFSYPVSGVTYGWSFVQAGANTTPLKTQDSGFRSQKDVFLISEPRALSSELSSTSVPRFTPASAGLVPGTYVMTVTVTSADGSQTQQAQAQITLVAAGLSGVKVYPNPWRADKHATKNVTFANLPGNCSVKIFTASGHLVKDLDQASGTKTWDLTSDSGDKVASGMYVYLIKDGEGNKVRGKIGVIR
jgi:hypothetical protein